MSHAPAVDPSMEPLLALLAELLVREAMAEADTAGSREQAGEVGRDAA